MHTTKVIGTGKKVHARNPIIRLKVFRDYNKKMGGIDKNDTMVNNSSCIQRSYKLSVMLFLHFLEHAIFNTYLFYNKSGGRKHFFEFKANHSSND